MGGISTVSAVYVLLSSAAIGVLFRRVFNRGAIQSRSLILWLMGLAISCNIALSAFLLPLELAMNLIVNYWVPVFIIYPVGTFLTGMLLFTISGRNEATDKLMQSMDALEKSNSKLQALLKAIPDWV